MDQIHLMKVFVAVGELESFAAAARRLDISAAAVTRAVSALEEQLGVKLLLRTTRSVRLTEAGGRYLEDTRHILASIHEANEAAAGINATPRGDLAVTAPILFGKKFVMPCIVRYLQQYPEVDVSAFFSRPRGEHGRRGHGRGRAHRAVARLRVEGAAGGQGAAHVVCLARLPGAHGVPKHPSDLAGHAIIGTTNLSPRAGWRFGVTDEPTLVRMKPRLTVTSNDGAIAAASGGLGIARLLSYQVADELARGELQVLLAEYEEAPWPIHVLHRESKYGSAKVRAFIDMLAQDLRDQQLD